MTSVRLSARSRRRTERGLTDLREMKRDLLTDLAHEADAAKRETLRRLIDVAEGAVYGLELVLYPAADA